VRHVMRKHANVWRLKTAAQTVMTVTPARSVKGTDVSRTLDAVSPMMTVSTQTMSVMRELAKDASLLKAAALWIVTVEENVRHVMRKHANVWRLKTAAQTVMTVTPARSVKGTDVSRTLDAVSPMMTVSTQTMSVMRELAKDASLLKAAAMMMMTVKIPLKVVTEVPANVCRTSSKVSTSFEENTLEILILTITGRPIKSLVLQES
jgi:hypothetical protein